MKLNKSCLVFNAHPDNTYMSVKNSLQGNTNAFNRKATAEDLSTQLNTQN